MPACRGGRCSPIHCRPSHHSPTSGTLTTPSQMLTGQQAWADLESPLQVLFAIGVQRKRLPIPPGCPPPIARLLKEW